MDDDAPPPPGLAERLTGPLAAADEAVNGVHDGLNAAVPWLWRPLAVPTPDEPLGPPHDVLYAVHAGVGLGLLLLIAPRGIRRPAAVGGALLAAASWAVFTGAWNRRAAQAASAARRAR